MIYLFENILKKSFINNVNMIINYIIIIIIDYVKFLVSIINICINKDYLITLFILLFPFCLFKRSFFLFNF